MFHHPASLRRTFTLKTKGKKGIVWVARRLVAAGGGAAVEQV
jgi:hypothetical protein